MPYWLWQWLQLSVGNNVDTIDFKAIQIAGVGLCRVGTQRRQAFAGNGTHEQNAFNKIGFV
jgi:hypothetical protein